MNYSILVILIILFATGCTDNQKNNILFIYTDDQARHSKELLSEVMPNLYKSVVNEAEEYTNYICSSPYCAPSRASLLTGHFSHNHKHFNNSKKYSDFYNSYKEKSLGILMQQAGYYTIFVGKYFNPGFPYDYSLSHIPEGWNEFLGMKGGKYLGTSYIVQQNGKNITRSCPKNAHRSAVEITYLEKKLIEYKKLNIEKPLFVYYAPFEPHSPQKGETIKRWFPKKYDSKFSDIKLKTKSKIDQQLHQNRLRSLNHLDDNLNQLFAKFMEFDLYDETYIFFTSDNGFKLNVGNLDKRTANEDDINVPFYLKHPDSKYKNEKNNKLIGTIDLLPSFLDIANADHPIYDGISILSSSNRNYLLAEMINEGQFEDDNWWALRSKTDKIVKYESGKIEHFNIKTTPEMKLKLDENAIQHKLSILESMISCKSNCMY